jgi:2-hydroxy-6-oxonona-2,4-dienedioate hydrolase
VDVDGREDRYRRAEAALWTSVGVTPVERWLRLERTAATVRVQLVGDGIPVVFVHGASNAGTSWAPLAARLGGIRCILLDRPGCGLSPPLGAAFGDVAALGACADALVVDVLDALGVAAAGVLGTSFGGYFALRAASAHPRRITRVVVLGWTFGAPVESTPLAMRVALRPQLRRLATRVPPTPRMVRSLLRQVGLRGALASGRFGAVEQAWFRSLLRDTATLRNDIEAAPPITTWRGFDEATLLDASSLRGVAVPTLFVWGEDDPMGGAAIARPFVAQIPGAQLELLAGAGHAPWIDEPDVVAARVGAFLRDGS